MQPIHRSTNTVQNCSFQSFRHSGGIRCMDKPFRWTSKDMAFQLLARYLCPVECGSGHPAMETTSFLRMASDFSVWVNMSSNQANAVSNQKVSKKTTQGKYEKRAQQDTHTHTLQQKLCLQSTKAQSVFCDFKSCTRCHAAC